MRTHKHYENFILEVDWMHVNKTTVGNSGIFVWGDALPAVGTPFTRGIEVQVLVNFPKVDWATNHGDLFSIWGATCKPDRPHPKGYARCLPSEERCKGGGEWNHYKITANNGAIKLEVNGKEVSGVSDCHPRKGYIALESEGAECHFRNLKIQELPSSNPKPEDVATVAVGHKTLFDGLSLNGWKVEGTSWKLTGQHLRCNASGSLHTEASLAPGELVFDWKTTGKGEKTIEVEAWGKKLTLSEPMGAKPGTWHRVVLKSEAGATTQPFVIKGKPGLEVMNLFHLAR